MSKTASGALKISSQTFMPELFADSLSTGKTLTCASEKVNLHRNQISVHLFSVPSQARPLKLLPASQERGVNTQVSAQERMLSDSPTPTRQALDGVHTHAVQGRHRTMLWQDQGLSL